MKFSRCLALCCVVVALALAGACSTCPLSQPSLKTSTSALDFDPTRCEVRAILVEGATVAVRTFENILYVANPVDAAAQVMNIYVPDAYFHNGRVGVYTTQTAPIFLPNQVGGYMPAGPGTLDGTGMPGPPDRPNTIALALARGYVVASPGARGRTSQNANGVYIGKAPAAIVDLKAAVRYMRHNDALKPGDAGKIISNGTSAGGALSALLGAAAARDDIFAVSAYCPIADLEHADAANERNIS